MATPTKRKRRQSKRGSNASSTKQKNQTPVEIEEAEDEIYEVEKIVGHRILANKTLEYLLKWKGYDESDNSYVPESDLNCNSLIRKYWNQFAKSLPPQNSTANTIMDQSTSDEDEDSDEDEQEITNEPKLVTPKKSPKLASPSKSSSSSPSRTSAKKASSHELSELEHGTNARSGESWEDRIQEIVTLTRDKQNDLFVTVKIDGKLRKVLSTDAYEKFPKKMCLFFERHISFTNKSKTSGASSETNSNKKTNK